jgi:hypothetical protein
VQCRELHLEVLELVAHAAGGVDDQRDVELLPRRSLVRDRRLGVLLRLRVDRHRPLEGSPLSRELGGLVAHEEPEVLVVVPDPGGELAGLERGARRRFDGIGRPDQGAARAGLATGARRAPGARVLLRHDRCRRARAVERRAPAIDDDHGIATPEVGVAQVPVVALRRRGHGPPGRGRPASGPRSGAVVGTARGGQSPASLQPAATSAVVIASQNEMSRMITSPPVPRSTWRARCVVSSKARGRPRAGGVGLAPRGRTDRGADAPTVRQYVPATAPVGHGNRAASSCRAPDRAGCPPRRPVARRARSCSSCPLPGARGRRVAPAGLARGTPPCPAPPPAPPASRRA